MSYDIYGNRLRRGHCEVHPHVHEEYPCSVCTQETNNRNAQSESEHYEIMRLEHELELSQQRISELEKREAELAATVEMLSGIINSSSLTDDPHVMSALNATPRQNLKEGSCYGTY